MALLESTQTLQPGDSAPMFTLPNITGKSIALVDFINKPVLVLFMCNHCPFVIQQLDAIIDLQNKFEDLVLIGVNSNDAVQFPDDNFENMQLLAEKIGLQYYVVDETQEVAKAYGAVCTPDLFLFDKEHKLVYHGRINNALSLGATPTTYELDAAITAVLTRTPIEKWFIPSMGCSIKWK